MIYFENEDGRVCILFPYLGKVLVGSTDIRVDDPATVRCEDDERDYILQSLAFVFPGITIAAGPDRLPASAASARCRASDDEFTGRIPRDHFVRRVDARGDAADALHDRRQVDDVPRLRRTGRRHGAGRLGHAARNAAPRIAPSAAGAASRPMPQVWSALIAGATATSACRARRARCLDRYGTDAGRVLAFCRDAPDDAARPDAGLLGAEIRLPHPHTSRSSTLADLLLRRTTLAITGDALRCDRSTPCSPSWPTNSAGRRTQRAAERDALSRPARRRPRRRPTRSSPNATATDRSLAMRMSTEGPDEPPVRRRPLPRRRASITASATSRASWTGWRTWPASSSSWSPPGPTRSR